MVPLMLHAFASHETFTVRNDISTWHHQSLPMRATFLAARRDENWSKRIFRDAFVSVASLMPFHGSRTKCPVSLRRPPSLRRTIWVAEG